MTSLYETYGELCKAFPTAEAWRKIYKIETIQDSIYLEWCSVRVWYIP